MHLGRKMIEFGKTETPNIEQILHVLKMNIIESKTLGRESNYMRCKDILRPKTSGNKKVMKPIKKKHRSITPKPYSLFIWVPSFHISKLLWPPNRESCQFAQSSKLQLLLLTKLWKQTKVLLLLYLRKRKKIWLKWMAWMNLKLCLEEWKKIQMHLSHCLIQKSKRYHQRSMACQWTSMSESSRMTSMTSELKLYALELRLIKKLMIGHSLHLTDTTTCQKESYQPNVPNLLRKQPKSGLLLQMFLLPKKVTQIAWISHGTANEIIISNWNW